VILFQGIFKSFLAGGTSEGGPPLCVEWAPPPPYIYFHTLHFCFGPLLVGQLSFHQFNWWDKMFDWWDNCPTSQTVKICPVLFRRNLEEKGAKLFIYYQDII